MYMEGNRDQVRQERNGSPMLQCESNWRFGVGPGLDCKLGIFWLLPEMDIHPLIPHNLRSLSFLCEVGL